MDVITNIELSPTTVVGLGYPFPGTGLGFGYGTYAKAPLSSFPYGFVVDPDH